DFVVGIIEAFERIEAGLEGALGVEGGDDDGDFGRAGQRKVRGVVEQLLDSAEGIAGLTLAGGQAEAPILDGPAAFPPIVGKAEDDGPGEAGAEGGLDLPGEHLAFAWLAFAEGVYAELTEHEGFGLGEHLEPGEVIAERLFLVEIDVEAHEIGALDVEEFG